jgi:hypothetical protein
VRSTFAVDGRIMEGVGIQVDAIGNGLYAQLEGDDAAWRRSDLTTNPMKLPAAVADVTLDTECVARAPFPPLGFVSFAENELGNGDNFGLYWPIGKEAQEPLVVESRHDSWTMLPVFSSLRVFLGLAFGADDWVSPPTIGQDAASPFACFTAGRDALARNAAEEAVSFFQKAVVALPEYGDAQWALSRQLARVGRTGDAVESALLAALAPPSWGGASVQALSWLKRKQVGHPERAADPLWLRRQELDYTFGGAKENEDYRVLREVIDAYVEQGDGFRASLLLQTYGELLHRETVSFQERHGFSAAAHIEEQVRVAGQFGMDRDTRRLAPPPAA